MNLVNLAVFDEDEVLKKEGTPIYPLQGEDLFFCVPRVGGFLYQKQIQDIIKTKYGIYHEQSDIDMNVVNAIWLGEYVTDFGGGCIVTKSQETSDAITYVFLASKELDLEIEKSTKQKKQTKAALKKIAALESKLMKAELSLDRCKRKDEENKVEMIFNRGQCRSIFNKKGYQQSLVSILINKASSFECYLTEEGREAIEELKKR